MFLKKLYLTLKLTKSHVKTIIISISALLSIVIISCNYSHNNKENKEKIKFNESAFSFVIPADWSKITNSQLSNFKSQFKNNVAEISSNYDGRKLDYDFGVPFIVGFNIYESHIEKS